jgi:dienelactone hydrolase
MPDGGMTLVQFTVDVAPHHKIGDQRWLPDDVAQRLEGEGVAIIMPDPYHRRDMAPAEPTTLRGPGGRFLSRRPGRPRANVRK